MDKNEAIASFKNYIGFRTEAKRELAEIKKISNLQEKITKVETSFEKHSRNFLNAQGILVTYNLNGEVNMNDFWEYSRIVDELKTTKDEFKEENNKNSKNSDYYICGCCKQTKSGQYWYNKTEGRGRVKPISKIKGFYSKFCSEECINLWKQRNLSRSGNINSLEAICHQCQFSFSNQPWTVYDERKKTTHEFCSQSCCDNFCVKYNQVVIAWNNLLLERKNLEVPNFPTWEELEIKQVSGELENYVEEVKKMINEIRQSSLSSGNNKKNTEETVPLMENNGDNSENNSKNDDKSNQIKFELLLHQQHLLHKINRPKFRY